MMIRCLPRWPALFLLGLAACTLLRFPPLKA